MFFHRILVLLFGFLFMPNAAISSSTPVVPDQNGPFGVFNKENRIIFNASLIDDDTGKGGMVVDLESFDANGNYLDSDYINIPILAIDPSDNSERKDEFLSQMSSWKKVSLKFDNLDFDAMTAQRAVGTVTLKSGESYSYDSFLKQPFFMSLSKIGDTMIEDGKNLVEVRQRDCRLIPLSNAGADVSQNDFVTCNVKFAMREQKRTMSPIPGKSTCTWRPSAWGCPVASSGKPTTPQYDLAGDMDTKLLKDLSSISTKVFLGNRLVFAFETIDLNIGDNVDVTGKSYKGHVGLQFVAF